MRVAEWVTYQDVAEAAEAIAAQGEVPTAIRLREYLGRGSNTTLQKYLNKWKQNKPTVNAEPPDPVNQAVKHVWEKLNSASQEELLKVKEDANHKLTTANERIKTLEEERAHFAQSWSNAKQTIAELNQLLQDTQQALSLKEQALELSQTKEALLEKSNNDLKESYAKSIHELVLHHQNAIAILQEQINKERAAKHSDFSALIAAQENQRHQWIVERDRLLITIEKSTQQIKALENIAQNLNEKMATLAETVAASEVKFTCLIKENNVLKIEKEAIFFQFKEKITELEALAVRYLLLEKNQVAESIRTESLISQMQLIQEGFSNLVKKLDINERVEE